jgi:hypothetical protein
LVLFSSVTMLTGGGMAMEEALQQFEKEQKQLH